ncbi:MAG: hypothetical protein IKQ91_08370 [Oscillospiraceae bacterium]|nr:hypothetical protein [Oscillospiraceae bacterium]
MAQHSNWKCPQCGNPDISGDLIKCPKCGKKRNRWGYWDCASCATKSIRADHKECPNCGRPRARNVKFYLRDDLIEFVDEVSGESAVRIGRANWICPYCNQQNDDAVDVCAYCSAARTESKERYHDVEPPKPSTPAKPAVKRKKQLSGCALGLIGCGGMLAILFIIAIISVLIDNAASKKVRQAESFAISWQCDVFLEEYKTLTDNGWELPADARLLEEKQEEYSYIDHYEQRSREVWVDDDNDYDWDDDDDWGGGWDDGGWDDGGWDDYGDGQFGAFRIPQIAFGQQGPEIIPLYYKTEYYEEPVYKTEMRTKYYYEYDAWVDGRTLTSKGNSDTEPYFEDFTLGDKERERERTKVFYVDFTDKDNPLHLAIPEEAYNQLKNESVLQYRRDVTENRTYPTYYLICNGQEYCLGDQQPDLIDDDSN